MSPLPEDPVVDEIRAVRQEPSERFGGDIHALCDFLAELEQRHPERLANRPAKAPQFAKIAAAERK